MKLIMFFSSLNQRDDIIICVYWFEMFSQVSDVAHGPLVNAFSVASLFIQIIDWYKKINSFKLAIHHNKEKDTKFINPQPFE